MKLLNIIKRLCYCCFKNNINEDDIYSNMTTNPVNPNNFETHEVYPYKKSFT